MGKYLDYTGLAYFWSLLKGDFVAKDRRQLLFKQDFMTNVIATWAPFSGGAISSGVAAVEAGNAQHPGCITLKSATTANSGYYVYSDIISLLLAGGEVFECIFKTPAVISASTKMRIGFADSTVAATAPIDGAYFDITSNTLTAKTASNSVVTTSPSSFTLVVATWYRARITIESASSALFEIFADNSEVVLFSQRLTSNIPTASGRNTGVVIIATNSGKVATFMITLDYISLEIARLLQR